MSKHDDTYSDDGIVCPYCGYVGHVEAEDYSEDSRETECSECGKKFYERQSFSVSHHGEPDCELNGEQHDYQLISLGSGASAPFCTVCGKCQPINERASP